MQELNPEDTGKVIHEGDESGTVTEDMIRERAEQIAFVYGRSPKYLQSSDIDQARMELLGTQSAASTR